jgi:hypothetical protein
VGLVGIYLLLGSAGIGAHLSRRYLFLPKLEAKQGDVCLGPAL